MQFAATRATLEEVFQRWLGRCFHCGDPIKPKNTRLILLEASEEVLAHLDSIPASCLRLIHLRCWHEIPWKVRPVLVTVPPGKGTVK